jgi:hypothetical protein
MKEVILRGDGKMFVRHTTIDHRVWPHTGRDYPNGAKMAIVNIHPLWDDLVWLDERRGLQVYLSTTPH